MKFIPPFTNNPELDSFLVALSRYVSDLPTGNITRDDGTVVDGGGNVVGYTKRYLHIKYATNNAGAGFSNSQLNTYFYGVFNSDDAAESSLWYDYTWYPVDSSNSTIGFSTNKNLYYKILGGRQVSFVIDETPPDASWSEAPTDAIDLEVLVADDSITNAKLANMAQGRIKGRISSGTGDPEDLTGTEVTSLLDEFIGDNGVDPGTKGLVPPTVVGDATKFLKGDGTWGAVASDVATAAIWDAKGDLIVGSGPDTAARLPVGTNDQVLVADSAETLGVRWADPASGGGVPYFIPDTVVWTLDEYYQGLFAETIDVEGTIEINGHLIGVD